MKNIKKVTSLALAAAIMLAGCTEIQTESGSSQTQSGTSSAQTDTNTSAQSTETSATESETSSTVSSDVSSDTSSDTSSKAPAGVDGVVTNGQVVIDINGETWGISLYGGGDGANYASYLNEFKEKVGSTVNVFNMVVPTASAFYLPEDYSSYNASHRDTVNSIANGLVNVINVDGYAALEAHTDEYIYTRTDHHWQPLGAYYAAMAFCEMAQVPVSSISDYEAVVIEDFVGTMYAFTDYNERINNAPDTFTYYVPSTDYKATYYTTDFQIDEAVKYFDSIFVEQSGSGAYSTFMGGDRKIVKIETANKNGRKLCVFKDSYGNAEIPFFVDSFEEIYVCDIRYFDLYAPDFISENGITDVLFTMCTFSAVGENAECIKTKLLAQ